MKKKLFTAASALAFLVSVSTSKAAEGIKLYQVSSGQLELDKGWLTAMRDVGKRIKIPVAMYIIDHPKGLVVYDTGMADDVFRRWLCCLLG